MLKRVAAVHDISCFGKCSLTIVLPIISAAGIETSVIPTAVLSTHTGGLGICNYRDLSHDILPIARHWKSLNLNFDALYTGYLGSYQQIDIIMKLFDLLDTKMVMVDPVMADNGKMYKNLDKDFAKGMKKLCSKADIIVPNITEAALLTDIEYKDGPYTKEYIDNLLFGLSKICNGKIVLTGVYFEDKQIGAAAYDNGKITYLFGNKVNGCYHGTGDLFASTLLSAILNDFSLSEAVQIAVDFTAKCIDNTKTDERYGVNFEQCLPSLIEMLKIK